MSGLTQAALSPRNLRETAAERGKLAHYALAAFAAAVGCCIAFWVALEKHIPVAAWFAAVSLLLFGGWLGIRYSVSVPWCFLTGCFAGATSVIYITFSQEMSASTNFAEWLIVAALVVVPGMLSVSGALVGRYIRRLQSNRPVGRLATRVATQLVSSHSREKTPLTERFNAWV